MHLAAVDRDGRGGGDAQANPAPPDRQHLDDDPAVDDEILSHLPGENQHDDSLLALSGGSPHAVRPLLPSPSLSGTWWTGIRVDRRGRPCRPRPRDVSAPGAEVWKPDRPGDKMS